MAETDELLGWLTGLDRQQLAKVLVNRPEALAAPWPRRLDAVAGRLAMRPSMNQATLLLSTPQVQVIRAIQFCFAARPEPVPVAEVARWLDTGTDVVESFVDDFADLALAWRDGGKIVLAGPLQSDGYSVYGLGRSVRGLLDELTVAQLAQLSRKLGLPDKGRKSDRLEALVAFFQDGEGLRELIATAPEPARNLLTDMADGIPEVEGLVPFHPRQGTPAAWAFEHGILFGTYYGSAYMPLEVSLALRGPDYRLPFTPDEPEYPTSQIGAEAAEAASASAALRLLDRVSTILDLAAEPLPLLKNGTIGARLVKKIAKDTGATPAEIELALDLATQAGLLIVDEPEFTPRPRRGRAPAPKPPTLVVNDQIVRPSQAVLFRHLLSSWWEAPQDGYDENGARDLDEDMQRLVLRLLSQLAPGTGIPDTAALIRLAQWHAPMYPPDSVATHVESALVACELLGLISAGAVTGLGRAMLDVNASALVKATDELVAHARTTALFGTDLTAIVPGSPDAALAALLDRAADRENQGTATSWRFSPSTVRRAFDQGATAATLLDELGSIAAGELPQPLVYLVNDVARRHGEARVIDVASVVVGEDPAVLAEIAAHRKLAKLGLHAVAPTVLTSTVDASGTLDALRDAGYAPTRHAADGSIIIPARDQIAPTAVVLRDDVDSESTFAPPDPLEHAARLLAAPTTGPGLMRGRLAKALSDRYNGRLTAKQQQLCWQLEAGLPVPVTYRADGAEPAELLIAYPELHGDALDVWSVHEHDYRRLELDRIDLSEAVA